jgi:dipeptidyl aminopeptidase/acylaminoacyl peptidase
MDSLRTPRRLPIRFMLAAAACVGLLDGHVANAGESKTPLQVFGYLPAIEDMAMSPDGTKFAYVRTDGDRRSVIIRQMGETKPLAAFRVGDTKLRGIQWLDDDNVLITRSNTGGPPAGYVGRRMYEWFQLATYSISRQKLADLDFQVHGNGVRSNAVYAPALVRQIDGETNVFAYGYYGSSSLMPALFRYSVANPHTWLIDKADEFQTGWLVDESGRVAAKFVFHDLAKKWELLVSRDDRMTVAASGQAEIDIPSVRGLSADGDSIIMEFIENGDPVWKPLHLKDGSWGEPLAKGAAFASVILDRKTGRIVGGIPHVNDGNYVFFDTELQAHWEAILRAFPGERVHLISQSEDQTKYLVTVFGAKNGYSYALFDWLAHRATVLAPVYEGLAAIAEVRRISYPAQDGLTIPGYLTMPPGGGEKNLPLIVLPHGGPWAADSQRFDWWAQALAAQGYAVLQPNFRGSSLSYQFVSAGFGQWGRKMQTDLSDGVHYLADQGVIDPKRVCIVGGSYGGYAALAGVTLDPGLYRCAISVAGISDMKRFRWGIGYTDSAGQRYMDRYLGTAHQGNSVLSAISPIDHADALTAPVLLIHGVDDTVVPYSQSSLMESVLKSAHKNVEFVTLKHEDHWLSSSQTRLQMLEASVAFLRKNNPPN